MKIRKINSRKLIFDISAMLLLLIAFFSIYTLITGKLTLGASVDGWDGVSVALNFEAGNGSINNPYIINSEEDFLYFKKIIEGDNYFDYQDKYFVLGADLDFSNHSISSIGIKIGEEERVFRGNFDGAGHSLSNIKIEGNKFNDTLYYGLFSKTVNASIKNLNINNMSITPKDTLDKIVAGTLVGESKIIDEEGLNGKGTVLSSFQNIVINRFEINFSGVNNSSNLASGFIGYISTNTVVNNIYLNGKINNVDENQVGNISIKSLSDTNNITVNIDSSSEKLYLEKVEDILYKNNYVVKNNKYYLIDKEILLDDILANYNELVDSEYYFDIIDSLFIIRKKQEVVTKNVGNMTKKFSFSISKTADIPIHESGVVGDTIYINDLDSDYNYYMGQNYTDYRVADTLPLTVGSNMEVYNDNNLVKVYMLYDGSDVNDNSLVGYMGIEEDSRNVSKFIYYKYYVVENGYIEIELIDNPYAVRPNNKYFQGWVTDYVGAEVSLNSDIYVRSVRIPVSSDTKELSITFNAVWGSGKTYNFTSSSNWGSSITSNLDATGMKEMFHYNYTYTPELTTLYVYQHVSRYSNYPEGALSSSGTSVSGKRCNTYGGCYYYILSSDDFDESLTYYEFKDGLFSSINVDVEAEFVNEIEAGENVAGYFRKHTISYNQSVQGYYDVTGNIMSGTCRTSSGCDIYELIQYYDNNGEVSLSTGKEKYYRLVTRDTNIVILTNNLTSTSNIIPTVPLTFSSINNVNSTVKRYSITNRYIKPSADFRVEYITFYSNDASKGTSNRFEYGSNYAGFFYGNLQNVKVGRGTQRNGSYYNATAILGAANNSGNIGSQSNVQKYRIIVESGYYKFAAVVNTWNGSNSYVDGTMIWGSDYDRVCENNENLEVYYSTAATWYSNLKDNGTHISTHTIVKSGKFGTGKNNSQNTNQLYTGIYVGGRWSGSREAATEAIIEGGWIFNLIGGPSVNNNLRKNKNDTYIFMKGGSVDFIFGGAGQSATSGNRIVSVTGGTVNYSVFGGSNASTGGSSDGKTEGSSLIYIGGNAIVGGDNLTATLFGSEAGSVFGIGNGNSAYDTVGSMNNSNIIIDGDALIKNNIYGGGNYGKVGISGKTITNINIINGHVLGSVYGGGNNAGAGTSSVSSEINITMSGGKVEKSVYGGSNVKGIIYGKTNIKVLNGVINTDVYGGGEGGYTNSSNPGTYVRNSCLIEIGEIGNGEIPTINGNVYGGSAYGTVNAVNQTSSSSDDFTKVIVNSGVIAKAVFGGAKGSKSFTPRVVGDIEVIINGGSIGQVFGGFDDSGLPSKGDIVYLNGGVVGNAFGGGNNADQTKTDIHLQGSKVTNVFGGSNLLGKVTESNLTITNGEVNNIYGGNNEDGVTITANVLVNNSTSEPLKILGDIYGGGNKAIATTSNVDVASVKANNIYGGGKEAGLTTANVNLNGTIADSVFGGSNISGDVSETNVKTEKVTIGSVYGGNNQGGESLKTNVEIISGSITNVFGGGDSTESGVSNVSISDGTIVNVYGGGNGGIDADGNALSAGLVDSNVNITGGNIISVFGGSNASGDIDTTTVNVGVINSSNSIEITNLYGGNNMGGFANTTNVNVNKGLIETVYGGGNEVAVGETFVDVNEAMLTDIYGGGNAAGVKNNTFLDIDFATITGNVYGGGNEGVVEKNTEVLITNAKIGKNVYAGGNGSTAIVYKNSSITIDGQTVIGTEDVVAPNAGCVFGSGNAAATGREEVGNSKTLVNIVGGQIYGNVYGGPKMSTVYGTTETNIGTSAVAINSLNEDDITIRGTVFGGGESNADGSENYDWKFISVTEGINVNINGNGYPTRNHSFVINGSIFGSGNASSSAGESVISIKDLGTKVRPNKAISIQRTNKLILDNSVLELDGATDRTNDYSDIKYSLNIIDLMIIKNNTILLLQHNANLLKELYSGVDKGGELVPASVEIDSETKKVEKNVDNRIYMTPNQNLNVTINQGATAYGKVTGMSFFGMYNSYANGSYRFGLYDSSVSYGDAGNAGMVIIGGSYVLGLHSVNHDITKDGFYSNYLDDEYTEVTTNYIDPTTVGETGYRWIIGLSAINYNFALTASKYSSLGTYELQMIDFADGDINFDVIGFNSEGLSEGIELVDSSMVPRIGKTEAEANKYLGLGMKAETQEWTSHGTTNLYSENNGKITGDIYYKTDSRKLAPSLMFYFYHAKNITLEGDLGTVVVMLQAAIPVNEIDYKIQLITITIDLVARKYEDVDSYDASITYDRRYEMPSSTSVNITNQSQFSAYYSLIVWNDKFEEVYGRDNSNFHVLTTNNPLPVGTMITMIDYCGNERRPEYYYYTITEEIYNNTLQQLELYNEITYRLSDFIKMGSTSNKNKYDDKKMNRKYYSEEIGIANEEFMFIFDMKDSKRTGNHLNNTMLFELRNAEDRTVYSVLGIRQNIMNYSTYGSSNAKLSQTITGVDEYLYYDVVSNTDYSTEIIYDQTQNRESVIDTNYESSCMGLNVSLYDKDDKVVSSSLLTGTSIIVDKKEYFADSDGVFRIKLAGKVSNINRKISLVTNKDLPPGVYTLKYTLFASDDGLHNSDIENSVTEEFKINVVGSDNAIVVESDYNTTVIDGKTALNLANKPYNTYKVKYNSELSNPNLRVEILKRDTTDIDSIRFDSVPFHTLFRNNFRVYKDNEVILEMGGLNEKEFNLNIEKVLVSGTYKVAFKLYDNDQLVDEDIKYVIVKKISEE